MLNKNTAPYFDSYDEDKQFYQVLYRPSYPVQARELNEMQSILQNQIQRLGNHIFKEGSMVIPGQIAVDNRYAFVKIESTFSGVSVASYIQSMIDADVIIQGQTSGVTAKIVSYSESTDTEPLTVFVKYLGSGFDGIVKTFSASEVILSDEASPRGFTVEASATNPVGYGTAVNIQRGVYYINGKFVLVKEQTLVLDKYATVLDAKVGLVVSEQFVTPEDDESLLDNAQGSSNYSAPGAHRHYINLTLSLDDGSSNFIELVSIKNGAIQRLVDTSVYSVLEDTLARRTYDESGNYTVTPFSIIAAEHRDNNRGDWAPNTEYLAGDIFTASGNTYVAETRGFSSTVAPSHTFGVATNGTMQVLYEPNPSYNDGEFSATDGGDQNKIAVSISAGKAYVLGHELTNTSTRFVDVNKTLEFGSVRNGAASFTLGSYTKVDNVYGKLDVTDMVTVDLYDRYIASNGTASGTKVGTAVARYMEYDSGTVGDAACKYILSLIDVNMNSGKSFESDARSIYFDNLTGVDFTCNIEKTLTKLTGSVSLTNGSAAVAGLGTLFTEELNPGDAVVVMNGTTEVIYNVLTITSNTALTLASNSAITLSGVAASRAASTFYLAANAAPIVRLPRSYIRKVRDIDNESISNTTYYVRQSFSGVVAGGAVTISTGSAAETFGSPQQPDSFLVTNATTGAVSNPSIALNLDSTSATITVGAGANGQTLFIVATVRKTLRERSKTVIRSFTQDFTAQADVLNKVITLSKTDGIKLRKVSSFTDGGGTPVAFGSPIPGGSIAVDITKSYVFDGGQRDTHYGLISIARSVGASAPVSPIRVEYDYYEHGTLGDYFSVDSYVQNAPEYVSESGIAYPLRDCIDFRVDKTSGGFAAKDFPAIGFDISSDYTFYLPRIDKLYLGANGQFGVSEGVSGVLPGEPKVPNDAMHLATLRILPKVEVVNPQTVSIEKVDNRRYTMSDIGKIDKRLQNVEYYTALNLLEQQTNNLQLFDENGNLNFKNGFIVDPFSGQNIVDSGAPDLRCSIDAETNSMRPGFSLDNISFIEKAATNAERSNSKYANNADIVTLPYQEVSEIVQPYATRTESVTPFIQFNYVGEIDIRPAGDEWYETTYAPAVIINQEGNYNALVAQFKSQLGTVWNAWQTTWTGIPSQITEVRTGTTTTIVPVYETKVVDDKIIRVDIIPWIRSRVVSFKAMGMKPNTLVYPFFDGTSVSAHVTPASILTVSGKVGTFDTSTSAGSGANSIARRIVANSVTTQLGFGDVIHNGSGNNLSLATATAIAMIDDGNTIRISNIRGTFVPGQTIYGSISGATAIVSAISSSTLKTNIHGEVAGLFTIPSTSSLKFAVGQKTFSLSSTQSVNSESRNSAETYAEGKYVAAGYLNVRQQTIISTRNGVVQKTAASETRTTVIDTGGGGDGGGGGGGGDPLAQSFSIENQEGMFVTSVDVYFSSKDRSVPVWFYIAEMSNGTPTKNVLPGSKLIIRPSDVNISSDGSIATRLKMKYPVYLQGGGTEYAFILGSDSTQYRVFVSQLGERDILTGKFISKQPYLGSMFKSQNASTWDPAQMEDIKFSINRAKFDIGVAANVGFIAEDISEQSLLPDPIFTRVGSNKVRVFQNNNGLTVGSKVTLAGCVAFNGISALELNAQHTVVAVEFDSYVIQVSSSATKSGLGGGSGVTSTKNIRFDMANLLSTEFKLEGTSLRHFLRPTSTAYAKQSEAIEVLPGNNVKMNIPMLVASPENESSFMSGSRSIEIVAELQSTNDYVSPVLDISRYSAALIGNRVDVPSVAKNISGLDTFSIGSSTAISFLGSRINTVSANTIFLQAKVGRVLQIAGATNPENNGTFVVNEVAVDGSYIEFADVAFTTELTGASIALTLYDMYVSEISPSEGSAEAKYIMKNLTLDIPASILNVYVDVSRPSGVDVELYYRVGAGSSVASKNWNLLTPVNPIKTSDSEATFDGAVYQLNSTDKFSVAQIKIVQKSSDTTKVAIFKNLRLIAMS